MFPRFKSPADELREERDRVAARKPHLALASFNPDPPKPAEIDHFVWKDVGELFLRAPGERGE